MREPVGVVGTVIPWNGPVATASLKISPALAAGCTVVLKPAPEGPVSTLLLAEALEAAELPEGVISVLPGGREVGEHLVRHRGIDKVSFTGLDRRRPARDVAVRRADRARHARARRQVGRRSSATTSPLEDVLGTLLPAGFGHSGQVCAAITRIFVSRSRHDELVDSRGRGAALAAGRRPARPRHGDRPAGRRAPARPRRGLHRQGQVRRARRWSPAAAAPRASTRAGTSSRPCSPTSTNDMTDRPRGDLRPGAHGDPVRGRRRRRADRQRLRLRAVGRRLHQRPRARRGDRAPRPHGPDLRQQRLDVRRRSRSAASSSPGSAARAASRASRRTSRPR